MFLAFSTGVVCLVRVCGGAIIFCSHFNKFLGIFAGDTVVLRGRRRRETVIVAQPDPELDADGKGDRVRVARQVRRNIRCHLGKSCQAVFFFFLIATDTAAVVVISVTIRIT